MHSQNSSPTVSVIIPTFNRSPLLARSIRSVFMQSFSDLELIIVDDGSTDNTCDVVSEFKDNRLRYIRFEQNRGIGAARAEGVSCATGEWVAFLDADDLWLSGKLEIDLAVFRKHPKICILFDNYYNINYIENIHRIGFQQTRTAFERLQTTELEPGIFQIIAGLPEALLLKNPIGTASIVTLRREVFQKAGNFNVSLSGPEDFEMMWRAILSGAQFAYNTRILVERYKDQGSITAQMSSFVPRYLKALDLCEAMAYQFNRIDLVHLINPARGQAWCNLLHTFALEGHRRGAWDAFRNSLHYGFTFNAYKYFIAALVGPQVIALRKKIKAI